MTSGRDQLAELICTDLMARAHDDDWGVPCVYPEVVSESLADAILAAGWRPPKPPCEHRMIVHGGACGSCGQMPPPPTEEDLSLLRTALARIERDNGERIGLDELAKEMGVDLDG